MHSSIFDFELLAIEARKQRNMANADGLREELQRAFRELESTVKEGRHRIDSEQSRQLRVRQSNLASLSNNLNELRRDHSIHVETLVRSKLKSVDLSVLINLHYNRCNYRKNYFY